MLDFLDYARRRRAVGEFDLADIQSPVTRLDHVVDLAPAVSLGFTLHIRIVVHDIVSVPLCIEANADPVPPSSGSCRPDAGPL